MQTRGDNFGKSGKRGSLLEASGKNKSPTSEKFRENSSIGKYQQTSKCLSYAKLHTFFL